METRRTRKTIKGKIMIIEFITGVAKAILGIKSTATASVVTSYGGFVVYGSFISLVYFNSLFYQRFLTLLLRAHHPKELTQWKM